MRNFCVHVSIVQKHYIDKIQFHNCSKSCSTYNELERRTENFRSLGVQLFKSFELFQPLFPLQLKLPYVCSLQELLFLQVAGRGRKGGMEGGREEERDGRMHRQREESGQREGGKERERESRHSGAILILANVGLN